MTSDQALLLSIRPEYVESIFAGTKTVELRRVKPRLEPGDVVVIYASGQTKGIVGAFEVAGITAATPKHIWKKHNGGSGSEKDEFDRYFEGTTVGYAIRIGKVMASKSAVPLGTLRKRHSGFRPPQSYHYWKLDELLGMAGAAFEEEFRGYLKSGDQRYN